MTNVGAMILRDIPPSEVVAHAQAIQGGFDELWVVEDLPFAGGISQAAAVLANTESVIVGHGIAPAPFRNPAALAMEWATLSELFPERVACGIGHGVQSWMAQIGERVRSPLRLLEETIVAVTGLLRGESVTMDGTYVQLADITLKFPPAHVPVVSAGVVGPKSLALSGQVAGGTIMSEGHGPAEIAAALELIGPVEDHHLTLFAGFYCGDPSGLGEANPDAPVGWDAVADTPEAVGAKLQTTIDAGVDSLILVPFGADPQTQLQLAASEIVPLLRR